MRGGLRGRGLRLTDLPSAAASETPVTPYATGSGAPCEFASNVGIWDANGNVNATALFTANATNASWPTAFHYNGASLVCNLCINQTAPAVCASTAWSTNPLYKPSGYLTYAPPTATLPAAQAFTPAFKAYTCTANGNVSACTCNVPGYPAAGFQTTGAGFAICQNMSAFYAIANATGTSIKPPAGITGVQLTTWMGAAVYSSAALTVQSPPPPPPPSPPATYFLSSTATLVGVSPASFTTSAAAQFVAGVMAATGASAVAITGVSTYTAAGRHLLQTSVVVSYTMSVPPANQASAQAAVAPAAATTFAAALVAAGLPVTSVITVAAAPSSSAGVDVTASTLQVAGGVKSAPTVASQHKPLSIGLGVGIGLGAGLPLAALTVYYIHKGVKGSAVPEKEEPKSVEEVVAGL